jgi:hypothetical protein
MVLRRAYGTLGGVSAVGKWGNVLEGNVVQIEEGRELRRRLVVKFKVGDREAVVVEERQHSFKCRDICRRSARLHSVVVDKATVESDENIFVAKIGRDRKAAREVGSGPFRVMGGVRVTGIGCWGHSKTDRATQRGRWGGVRVGVGIRGRCVVVVVVKEDLTTTVVPRQCKGRGGKRLASRGDPLTESVKMTERSG